MAKILTIDDEPSLLRLVQLNLIARGYQALCASDGEQGVAMAVAAHPDLILVDLLMPGISGWEVIAALKSREGMKEIPVILMTAAPQKEQEEKARRSGAVGYLLKPFGVAELLGQVILALGETENRNDGQVSLPVPL